MTDVDDYYEDEGPAQEEPNCMSCNDSGCPDCGQVNPDDPEHLRAVAIRILQSRMPVVPRGVEDDDPQFIHLHAAAVATIRELVATAVIETDIRWYPQAEQGDPWAPAPAGPTRISPDAGNPHACNCNGAWHAMQDHCVTWPCPGCDHLCPPEPGTENA
jgi:hypothetical protein